MDQYCLKWGDFQANVSKSISSLRMEKDFFDVTLVSDDEQHISAHKVVLSASSEFFKNILKKSIHSSPMIFLSGVGSSELNSIMDYIYQGEVQLYQDDLDQFLAAAEKLKVDGLMGTGNEKVKNQCKDPKNIKLEENYDNDESSVNFEEEYQTNPVKRGQSFLCRPSKVINSSNIDAKAAVDELIMKEGDVWLCKPCGKIAKTSGDMRKHAEIHIEGLSYDCQICNQSFRSRCQLNNHKQTKFHKSKIY